jgi:hypothetical protein
MGEITPFIENQLKTFLESYFIAFFQIFDQGTTTFDENPDSFI